MQQCYLDNELKRDTNYILLYNDLPPSCVKVTLCSCIPWALTWCTVHIACSRAGLNCTCVAHFIQKNGSPITHYNATSKV